MVLIFKIIVVALVVIGLYIIIVFAITDHHKKKYWGNYEKELKEKQNRNK